MEFAKWIRPERDMGDVVPLFFKSFEVRGDVSSAVLSVTAVGVYEAALNGARVGEFLLAPGWTDYDKRLQVQTYDVTELLREDNLLTVLVGRAGTEAVCPGSFI